MSGIDNIQNKTIKLPEIRDSYQGFNIREIYFDDPMHDRYNFGILKHISDTNASDNPWVDEDFGIDIYQTYYDSGRALRVNNKINYLNYLYYQGDITEAKFVDKLRTYQDKIKLTEFPTGIVTFGGTIIGQEIPYYDNYQTLKDLSPSLKKDELKFYLLKIIGIIEELLDNGIYYSDVHNRNFVIEHLKKEIKLIDFDDMYVKFNYSTCDYQSLMHHIYELLNGYNLMCNGNKVDDELNNMNDARKIILKI